MNPLLVDLLTKRIPAFAAEKSASKEADMADAYESLKNNIALYQSTKDSSPEDYNYAGKKVAESLNRFGITQPNGKPLEWSADDTSDKRIQTIEHAIKNFEKGSFTGRDFFDRINYAVKGEYTPTTLDPEVMKGLLSGQAAGQSKSAAGYLAALGSDSETPAGAGQRMVATGQISPKYVNDPQWMAENAAGLLDIAKNGGGDISNDAIKAQMAQNLPPSYTLSTKSSEPGLLAYANQQDMQNKALEARGQKSETDIMTTPQVRYNEDKKRNEVWYFDKSGKPKEFVRVATASDMKDKEKDVDDALIKKIIQEMPKLEKEARAKSTQVGTINQALEIIKLNDVTGKLGQLKSIVAPYAEAFGLNTKDMDASQTYQLLTRAMIGPMRLDIVGPGPVSEWEQKLMQQISGGGGAGKEAAITLLNYYKKVASSSIDNYNEKRDGLVEFRPNAAKLYKKIDVAEPKQTQSVPTTQSTAKPKTWEELKKQKGY